MLLHSCHTASVLTFIDRLISRRRGSSIQTVKKYIKTGTPELYNAILANFVSPVTFSFLTAFKRLEINSLHTSSDVTECDRKNQLQNFPRWLSHSCYNLSHSCHTFCHTFCHTLTHCKSMSYKKCDSVTAKTSRLLRFFRKIKITCYGY